MQWAEAQGIHYQTARRWFKNGTLPVSAEKVGGLILVHPNPDTVSSGETVIYSRVSSSDQRADLDRQVGRIAEWAGANGHSVDRVVTEVGSALNGKRRKFIALLSDPDVSKILVEHRDRFARFGAEYIEAALAAQGRTIVVVDPAEVDDDLVRDVTEILTSLCARLFGRRAAANRAAKAIKTATDG